ANSRCCIGERKHGMKAKLNFILKPSFNLLALCGLLLPLAAGAQTITITNPIPNAVVPDGVLSAAGTGQFPTASRLSKWVSYSLNGGPWQTAIGTMNWSVPNL